MNTSAFVLGIAFVLLGILIIAKTRSVEWADMVRAIVFQAPAKAYLKWLGLASTAVGIAVMLAALGFV